MPFTLSHPALVIPFFRRVQAGGWKTSLFFGAMSPDFWVLGPGLLDRASTHGRWGILLCPPIALFFAWVFHRWFLPRIQRLPGIPQANLSERMHWRWASVGVLVGTATHLLWDQLTHEGSRLQAHHPIFDEVLLVVGNDAITIGQMAWIGSSMIGLAVLAGWTLWNLLRSRQGLSGFLRWQWLMIGLAAVVPGLSYFTWRLLPLYLGQGWPRVVFDQVTDIRYLVIVSALSIAVATWVSTGKRKSAP